MRYERRYQSYPVQKHYQTILERNGYVTAEKVRNTFLGKEEKAKTLLQVFAQHNEQYALKVGVCPLERGIQLIVIHRGITKCDTL